MKTIAKTLLVGSLVLAAVVGCRKDNVAPIPFDADTIPTVDTVVIDVPTFDTIPASFDGFDIRGRWLWATPYSPNRLLITFRDDSIAVFTSYLYDSESIHSYIMTSMDSAKYRTVYNSADSYKKIYFYHRWMTDGTIDCPEFNIYSSVLYLPKLYDNQNTMYMRYGGFVLYGVNDPWEEDFYVVRYNP